MKGVKHSQREAGSITRVKFEGGSSSPESKRMTKRKTAPEGIRGGQATTSFEVHVAVPHERSVQLIARRSAARHGTAQRGTLACYPLCGWSCRPLADAN